MLWYPFDFTFVCPTEVIAFSDRHYEFSSINTQVIGASCDSKYSHLAWVGTPRKEGGIGDVSFPLIADFDKKIATQYGVLITDGEDAGAAQRAMFIIDPTGLIRHLTW